MSEAHIPQPDSGVAPAEQIQSVDSVPVMQSIEMTAPTPPDIVPALGEFNAIDPYFYKQLIRLDTIQWTTSDESGKLLWYIPLAPQYMHKNLAYICRMYYAWIGDFEFTFKVAGTGFHAGLVTLFATPPGIHPTKVTSPTDFTYFAWDAMDPKTLQIGSIMGRDKRKVKYHRTDVAADEPEENKIGGYLAMSVDLPLSTSSSGVPRINIAIWVRCMPSFQVSTMMPYDLQEPSSIVDSPPTLQWALNFSAMQHPSLLAAQAEVAGRMLILPKSIKVLNNGVFNCSKLSGEPMSKFQFAPFTSTYRIATVYEVKSNQISLKDVYPAWNYLPTVNTVFFVESNPSIAGYITKIEGFKENTQMVANVSWYTDQRPTDGQKVKFGIDTFDASPYVDNEYAAKTNNESFIVFSTKTVSNVKSAQTAVLAQIFSSGMAKTWIPAGMSALFQIVEVASGLPVGYAKLYNDGFFTSKATENQIEYDVSKMQFKFVQLILETGEIPSNPSFSQNAMLIQLTNMAARKRSERTASAGRPSILN